MGQTRLQWDDQFDAHHQLSTMCPRIPYCFNNWLLSFKVGTVDFLLWQSVCRALGVSSARYRFGVSSFVVWFGPQIYVVISLKVLHEIVVLLEDSGGWVFANMVFVPSYDVQRWYRFFGKHPAAPSDATVVFKWILVESTWMLWSRHNDLPWWLTLALCSQTAQGKRMLPWTMTYLDKWELCASVFMIVNVGGFALLRDLSQKMWFFV